MRTALWTALAAALVLGGCATKPKKTVEKLDEKDTKYQSAECVEARKHASEHKDYTLERIGIHVASHALLGPFALPITVGSHVQKADARNKVNKEVVGNCVTGGQVAFDQHEKAKDEAEARAAAEKDAETRVGLSLREADHAAY